MDRQYHTYSTQESMYESVEEVSQTTSKRPARGPGFTTQEDQLLISAWLNTGIDPIHGNEQKLQTFWGKITAYYHEYKTFDSDRSQLMLCQRWGKIQKLVNKFSGCIAAINGRNESGKTEQDKIADAKRTYAAQEKGKKFNLDHAWILLRNQPKWIHLTEELNNTSKKRSQSHISSSSNIDNDISIEDEINIGSPMSRPLGKKTEKRRLKETTDQFVQIQKLQQEKKERDEKKIEIMKEKVEVDKEKLRVRKLEIENKKMEAEMKIMSMDTTIMNPVERAYYSKMQMKILQGDT